MYVAESRAPIPAGTGRVLTGNVLALGWVSLLTDVSSEMVTAVLPVYLVFTLGLGALEFGFLDGLYTGATTLLRLAGGHVADRFGRRKPVAGVGYGLSAVSKLGFLAVGSSVPGIGLMIGADRMGKGLRTAPRDAIISLSAPGAALGRAFGLHRAMDTAGAMAGPLVAFGVLALAAQAMDAVFFTSFCVAAVGVLVLVLFVREPATTAPASSRPTLRAMAGLLGAGPFRRVVLAVLLLSLTTVSDAFLYLLLQQLLGLPPEYLPLLPVVVAGVYLAAAVPFGRLADRVGRRRAVFGGYAGILACYALVLAGAGPAPVVAVAVLAVRGLAYAATDGVQVALAGPFLPERVRAMGIAVLQTAQALAAMCCSWLFGALWAVWGPSQAVGTLAGGMTLALAASWLLLRGTAR
ncbi:MFS transporter [Thermoactinospora rubra]|uniref:MFS transporter n=1 Tax=Thermoactinospora rubra TaxID=1088767 RepID=UPI000A0FD846|nr:MFS transporter [Thermoactinospora rubra]